MEADQDFSRLCKVNGLGLEQSQLDVLRHYVTLLLEWNSKINLVSRNESAKIWINHILHSISPLFTIEVETGSRILDLGTGGGLPGIPIAIARRDVTVTLLDSIRKKALALEDMVGKLGLTNVSVVCSRAEEFRLSDVNKAGFDVVVARAVAPAHELIKWSLPLVRREEKRVGRESLPSTGHQIRHFMRPFLLALKGGNLTEEIAKASARYRDKKISVVNLNIRGVLETELEDKKVLVAEL